MFKIGDDKLHYEKFADGSVVCIEDEIPFDIPESWAWCRLKNIGIAKIGLTYKPTDIDSSGIAVLRSNNIKDDKLNLNELIYVNCAVNDNLLVMDNDILICARNGSKHLVGKSALIKKVENKMTFGAFMSIFRSDCNNYIFRFLNSNYFRTTMADANSTQINQLTQDMLKETLCPLPPHSEQKRISETVETLLELVDSIASDKIDLSDLIKQTKAKVLDLAIKGKLVPQDPNDEPTDKLLEKIREEKERLIKEGKLKRDKNETYIFKNSDDNSYYEQIDGETVCIDDDLPFEIPQSWRWCKVDNVTTIKGGKRLPSGQSLLNDKTNHPYLRIVDMKNNTIIDDDIHYISEDVFAKIKQYIITDEDLYITIAGTIGNVGIIPSKYNNANLTENAVRVTPLLINKKYLMYLILSNYVQNQFIDKTHHVAMPKLAIERIKGVFVPIPPLFEQSNIINKLESIFSYLDNLESIIKGS